MTTLFQISDLKIDLLKLDRRIVDVNTLSVGRGEVTALVGESGSGKSTVGLAALGYVKPGARIASGRIELDRIRVPGLTGRALREFRRYRVGYVPQDPGSALNPALKLRTQLDRALGTRLVSRPERAGLVAEALGRVGLPNHDAEFLLRYPQQLSGGQQQRVLIAMAFINRPDLIVWDEPTTGLDTVTKKEILALVRSLSETHGIAGLYISHDLAAVAEIADSVAVMQAGKIVEQGTAACVLRQPQHTYTRQLISAVPSITVAAQQRTRVRPPILDVRGLSAAYGATPALEDISFDLREGECLAIVGESGSGKSTLSRTLVGVGPAAEGTIAFDGADLPLKIGERSALQRRGLQYVFQNPYGSLQPRRTVGGSIRFAAAHVGLADPETRTTRSLEKVGLGFEFASRFPDELSGGERQRAALARALVIEPRLLVCDEITSALDVSIQAQIIDLLRLMNAEGVSLIFVTHDLAVAKALAHQVVVVRRGRIVEAGDATQVFEKPQAQYTRDLLRHSESIAEALHARRLGPRDIVQSGADDVSAR